MRLTGTKVAGHRGYYLVGDGVDLNQALITYGLEFLREKGYTKIQPPFFMNKSMMSKTAQLEEFDEALYKVSCLLRARQGLIGRAQLGDCVLT